MGAAAHLREELGSSLSIEDQKYCDGKLPALRAQLGDAGFKGTWEAGWGMALDDAIAYALADDKTEQE
jgi:hypothetical protein